MNKSIRTITGFIFIILYAPMFAQESVLLPDKQGDFKIINWSVYGMSGTDFTKSEENANYKKLVAITDVIRQNPVMKELRGFAANARLYGRYFDRRNGYGIPCQLAFEFCYFFLNSKGKEVKVNIEPPHWDIEVNRIKPLNSDGFGYSSFKPSEKPKAGFNYEKWNEVGEKIRDLFYIPGNKETIERGLDRYGAELVVVYNPDRPDFWVPVTLREASTLLMDYWKLYPDQIQSEYMSTYLEAQFSQFSESDLDGYAYNGVGGVGSDKAQVQVMRINPEYWNKKLPRSAIQIIAFNCAKDISYLKYEMNEKKKHDGGSYHIERFLLELDIKSLMQVIDK